MISSVAVNFCTALPLEVATSPSQRLDNWTLSGCWAGTGTPHSQHPLQQRRGWHPRVIASALGIATHLAIDIMEDVSRLTLCGRRVIALSQCVCGIIGCLRPRLRGEFCHQHKAVRAFTLDLMLVDILDFLGIVVSVEASFNIGSVGWHHGGTHRDERVEQNTFAQSPCSTA